MGKRPSSSSSRGKQSSSSSSKFTHSKKIRPIRTGYTCDICRHRHTPCISEGTNPCEFCIKRGLVCVYSRVTNPNNSNRSKLDIDDIPLPIVTPSLPPCDTNIERLPSNNKYGTTTNRFFQEYNKYYRKVLPTKYDIRKYDTMESIDYSQVATYPVSQKVQQIVVTSVQEYISSESEPEPEPTMVRPESQPSNDYIYTNPIYTIDINNIDNNNLLFNPIETQFSSSNTNIIYNGISLQPLTNNENEDEDVLYKFVTQHIEEQTLEFNYFNNDDNECNLFSFDSIIQNEHNKNIDCVF
jgi:hypothetical protein